MRILTRTEHITRLVEDFAKTEYDRGYQNGMVIANRQHAALVRCVTANVANAKLTDSEFRQLVKSLIE